METGQNYTTLQKTNSTYTNQENRLSVQVTLHGLSFLILSTESHNLSLLNKPFDSAKTPEELLDAFDFAFKEEISLQQDFAKVSVLFSTPYYTLVPTSLFQESKASEYLKFNSKILPTDFIAHDALENHGITVVYVPFVNVNNYLFEKFGTFDYYHNITVLLKYFLDKEKYALETKVILHVEAHTFDCLVLKNGNVELCNSYPYKTLEDFIYFVLFAMEQLTLNPNTTKVILCGAISEKSPLFKILYSYVRHVSFIEDVPSIMENEENHKNFALKILI